MPSPVKFWISQAHYNQRQKCLDKCIIKYPLSFQAPYNQITYTLQTNTQNINTYFEINSNTGDITVRIPLYNDITDTARYTFTVIARDGGNPQRQSVQNAQVTINVIRNLNPPVFQAQPYTTSVPFIVANGIEVFDLLATDADTVVSVLYSVRKNNPCLQTKL